jgi:hypothetical protein
VVGCCAAIAACGSNAQPAPTKVQKANESGISIMAEFDASNVREIAQSHCHKFGKRAVVEDATPVGDTVVNGWAYGNKPYIFSYSCF